MRVALSLIELLLVQTALLPATYAGAPLVDHVKPKAALSDETVRLRLLGEGFEPGARPAILTGGPREIGYYVTGSYADTYDIAVEADVAVVVGAGYPYHDDGWLWVLDVSDPANPIELAYSWFPHAIQGVDVVGAYAFVTSEHLFADLMVFDISKPAEPVLVGWLDMPGPSRRVFVSGEYAFLSAGERGLMIVDVSNPRQPALVGSEMLPGSAYDAYVTGDRAYVAAGSAGLHVVDVSSPQEPTLLGSVATPGSVRAVAVRGHHAYVTEYWDARLLVVDVENGSQPTIVGEHGFDAAYAHDVTLEGAYAFVASWGAGIVALDINDPRRPTYAGRQFTWGHAYALAVENGFAYVADGFRHVRAIDVSNPTGPAIHGHLQTLKGGRDIATFAGFAYVLTGARAIEVIDVTDLSDPHRVLEFEAPGDHSAVAAGNGALYLATRQGELHKIDVSNPASPLPAGHAVFEGQARDLALSDGLAVVAAAGLQLFDVSGPGEPVPVAHDDETADFSHVDLVGDRAYAVGRAGDGEDRLWVYRVGAAEGFVPISSCELPGSANGIVADESGLVFVALTDRRLLVIDTRRPDGPVVVGELAPSGYALPVDLVLGEEGLLYVAHLPGSVEFVDVRDPQNPTIVGAQTTHGAAFGIAALSGHALVALSVGLDVVLVQPRLEEVSWVSPNEIGATLPAGSSTGPYHVLVTNPGDERGVATNAFRVCARRALHAWLEPQSVPEPPLVSRDALAWRLRLEGDESFFGDPPLHEAWLGLPELPASTSLVYEPASTPRAGAIELHLYPAAERARVKLIGPDQGELERLWDRIRGAGRIPLPRLDARSYGDIALSSQRAPARGESFAAADGRFLGGTSVIYRYEFSEDTLTAARAWGRGADHVFEAKATYDWTCEVESTVSYAETITGMCEEFAGEHPEVLLDCEF